jgi:hypothetical protein
LDASPPHIVIEEHVTCTDGDRARAELERALAPAKAPEAGWAVTLRLTRLRGVMRAEGEITDANVAPVAQRGIERVSGDCGSMARAIGVWASIVLDDELQRAQVLEAAKMAASAPPDPSDGWKLPGGDKDAADAREGRRENARSFEIGVASHMMSGTGTGTIAGLSAFTVSELSSGWFLRPALAIGRSTSELSPSNDVYATWGAARVDVCSRLSGNYLERRGLQLDLCGGTDLGFMHFDEPEGAHVMAARTTPFMAIGPSIAIRGELGSDLAVFVRAVAELNVLPETFIDSAGSDVEPSWLIGRGEVGLSWRLQ